MDDGYVRNTKEVMAYLAQKARSEWTMRQHRECLAGLAERLREGGLGHSEDVAWEWPEGIAGGLGKTRRGSHVGALAKLGDTCATGETGSLRHGAPKKEGRPCGRHRRLVDDCRARLRGSGLAPATVGNHRAAATRLPLDPRGRGAGSVADAPCADLARVPLACEGMACRAKARHRGMMRSLLAHPRSIGLVRHGLAPMVDAMVLRGAIAGTASTRRSSRTLASPKPTAPGASRPGPTSTSSTPWRPGTASTATRKPPSARSPTSATCRACSWTPTVCSTTRRSAAYGRGRRGSRYRAATSRAAAGP